MSKKLEDLFNLSSMKIDEVDDMAEMVDAEINEQNEMFADLGDAADKIDIALPTVHDLSVSDAEMDEIAKLARKHFDELMELGMSVESRFSSAIFQNAGMMLGHAINAKQTKLDKKLKMVELQLKKAALDQRERFAAKKASTLSPATGEVVDAETVVVDRNSLLQAMLNRAAPTTPQ